MILHSADPSREGVRTADGLDERRTEVIFAFAELPRLEFDDVLRHLSAEMASTVDGDELARAIRCYFDYKGQEDDDVLARILAKLTPDEQGLIDRMMRFPHAERTV